MRARRIFSLVTATVLAVGSVPAGGLVSYDIRTPGPERIEVRVNEFDAVSWMGLATGTGRLEMFVDDHGSWAEYELSLRETGERYRMTLTDGGDGSWHVTTDFGSAGRVSFSYETDGTLTPGPSSLEDCHGVIGSPLYGALQDGLAAAASAGGADPRQETHLRQVAGPLGIVVESVNIQDDVTCGAAEPNVFWNFCYFHPTYEECSSCCDAASEAAATAMVIPCAAAGPVPAGACLVAVAAALYSCRATCYVYSPSPDSGEGDQCGGLFSMGHCFELCPDDTYDGGQLGCDAPLTCCISAE